MENTTIVSYAGMDCHRTFSRLTARGADHRVLFRQRLEHDDRPRLRGSFEHLPAGTPVIMEGSFGWGWMSDELKDCHLDPHLVNCRKADKWREAKGMVKTNKLDADLLSELWPETTRWWEVWLAPQEVRDQREWLRYRMGLVRMQTMTKCRIHAVLHRHGILNPHSDLFGAGGREFLQLLVQADGSLRDAARKTLGGHLRLLEQLRSQIAQATRDLRRQVKQSASARRWDTLPGVGWILAYTIQAEIGDISRFPSAKKLSRYCLLAPIASDSGEEGGPTPVGRRVGHIGRSTLKYAFIEAAHGAVRKSPRMAAIFNRITDGGKRNKNRGYIAVARHLCEIGFAMQSKGADYMEQRPLRPGERSPAPAEASECSCPESGQPEDPMVRSQRPKRKRRRRP